MWSIIEPSVDTEIVLTDLKMSPSKMMKGVHPSLPSLPLEEQSEPGEIEE